MSGTGSACFDDADRIRQADDHDLNEFGRRDQSAPPSGAIALAQTLTVSSYPTSTGEFVAVQIKSLMGTETEGSSGVTTIIGTTQYAYIPVGAPIPTTGSEIVIAFVPYRWVLLI